MSDDQPRKTIVVGETGSYYTSDDLPDVLRWVRFINRFFDEIVSETFLAVEAAALYGDLLDRLNKELAPHAADLALSLIALEDEHAKDHPAEERPRDE
jgi:hypothetical protein